VALYRCRQLHIRFAHLNNNTKLEGLASFVSYMQERKVENSDGAMIVERDARERIIASTSWDSLLGKAELQCFAGKSTWDLIDVLDCILSGEYELTGVKPLDDTYAILEFEPLAIPFGGTDPLKALVEGFGFDVVGDSFQDGFVEWQKSE